MEDIPRAQLEWELAAARGAVAALQHELAAARAAADDATLRCDEAWSLLLAPTGRQVRPNVMVLRTPMSVTLLCSPCF